VRRRVTSRSEDLTSHRCGIIRTGGLNRRELTIMAAAVVGGGIITFALIAARGNPRPCRRRTSHRRSTVRLRDRRAPRRRRLKSGAPRVADTGRPTSITRRRSNAGREHRRHLDERSSSPDRQVHGEETEAFVYTGSALRIEPNTEITVTFGSMTSRDAPSGGRIRPSTTHCSRLIPLRSRGA
jgi:hypothetical protein